MATKTVTSGRVGNFRDAAGADTYIVFSDTRGLKLSGNLNGDTIAIDGFSEDFRVSVSGRRVTLTNLDKETSDIRTISFTVAIAGEVKLQFVDGSLDVVQSGSGRTAQVSVGGVKVTKTGAKLSGDSFQGAVDAGDAFDPVEASEPAPEPTPTFMLTSGSTTVNEGSTVVFTLNTTNVDAGSVYSYVLSGVSASDVVGGALTGTTTVGADGKAVVAVQLAADATTEGVENMTMTLAGQTASVSVADTSTTPVPPVPVLNAVLTLGVDGVNGGTDFTGDTGNDTFTAAAGTWGAFDVIDGVSGNDTFTIAETGAITGTPAQARVLNIDTINISSSVAIQNGGNGVTLNTTTDTTNYTGLSALNVTTSGTGMTQTLTTGAGVNVTASGAGALTINGGNAVTAVTSSGNLTIGNTTAAVGAVSATHTAAAAAGTQAINGGSSQTVSITGVALADTEVGSAVTLGGVTPTTGAVNVTVANTSAAVGAETTAGGVITVNGGSTVTVNQSMASTAAAAAINNAANTTAVNTQGAVNINGTASTTTVTVNQTAAIAAANGAGNPATGGRAGVVAGAVTITDAQAGNNAAGTISSVSLTNFGNSTVDSSALTSVTLGGTGGTFGIGRGNLTAAPTANTLALNLNALTGTNTITDQEAAAGDDGFTTINLANTGTTVIADLVAADLTTLNISGSGSLTFTANTLGGATTTAITSTSTGSVRLGGALNVATAYTGGEGVDTITVGATTRAINTGGGDDVVTMSVAVGTGGSVDGGTGNNTLVLTAANAADNALTANATFEGGISNFTRLSVGAGNATINLANLDDINHVTVTGANSGTKTFSNASSGATLVITDTSTSNTVALATNGAADVLNVTLTNAADTNYGTVVATGFETVAITATESGALTANVIDTATLTLTNANATTITVGGNANLLLTHTGTALTRLDASANLRGGVALTTAALTGASTLTGGANGNVLNAALALAAVTANGGAGADTLTGSATVGSTLNGNGGNDTLTGGAAADVINGGDGTDTFVFSSAGVVEQAGASVTTGVVINLSDAAISSAALFTATGDFLPTNVASVAANTATYLFGTESGTNASVVDTLSSIENATGTDLADYIVGSSGANVITGGTGADTMTGGAGADTFVFAAGDTGVPAANNFDVITDFTSASDIIDFAAALTIVNGNVGFAAAVASISAAGIATFDNAANTTALRIVAAEAGIAANGNAAAGQAVLFQGAGADAANAYLFISDGVDGVGANDVLIQLTGVNTTLAAFDTLTLANGNATIA